MEWNSTKQTTEEDVAARVLRMEQAGKRKTMGEKSYLSEFRARWILILSERFKNHDFYIRRAQCSFVKSIIIVR